ASESRWRSRRTEIRRLSSAKCNSFHTWKPFPQYYMLQLQVADVRGYLTSADRPSASKGASMKIGKIQLHLKAWSHPCLSHVSALMPLPIISLTPNRALEDAAMFVKESWSTPYNQLGGANDPPCGQTEDQRSHPNGSVP